MNRKLKITILFSFLKANIRTKLKAIKYSYVLNQNKIWRKVFKNKY